MAVTLNASNSGTGGLSVTSDATGNLAFQTAGTTAVSISASQVVTLTNALAEASGGTGTTTGYYGFKNRIINGGMVIDQRNAGASVTPNGTYTLDRWSISNSQTGKLTVQQNAGSVTLPTGFTNYLGITSTSAYSVLTGDYFWLGQRIEGFNVGDLAWGTASASAVTLSFKVYSSLTGTFGGVLRNNAGNYNYPFSYTVSSANTWTNISVTIAGPTSGTWVTNNGVGIELDFSIGMGSTYGSGTAGAWTTSNYYAPTGSVNVVSTNGATFYITGVQLEKGSTATSFDYRPYGTELALCQRYYYVRSTNITVPFSNTTDHRFYLAFKSTMRTTPTVTATQGAGGGTQVIEGQDAEGVVIGVNGSTSRPVQLTNVVATVEL